MIRKLRYFLYRLKFKYPALNNHLPVHVDIELNRSCNLQCSFCYRQDEWWQHQFPNDMMLPKDAKTYLETAYSFGIRAVKFNWRGDPSCYSRLAEVCKHAYNLGYLDIMLNTNLAGRDIRNVLEASKYLTEIRVSIDTVRSSLYAEMRTGGEIQQTIENLAQLDAVFKGRLIIQRRTSDKCENNELFIRELNSRLFNTSLWMKDYDFKEIKNLDSKPIQPRITNVNFIMGDKKISLVDCEYSFNEVWKAGYLSRQYCKQPSQRIVIGVDGKVFMCCLAYSEPQELYLGNINKIPLDKMIYSYARAVTISKLMNENFKGLPTCEKCTSYTAYELKGEKNAK